jgi:hypothetical protein
MQSHGNLGLPLQTEEFATAQPGRNREHNHQPCDRLQLSQDRLNFLWFKYDGISPSLRTLPDESDRIPALFEPFAPDRMVEQNTEMLRIFAFSRIEIGTIQQRLLSELICTLSPFAAAPANCSVGSCATVPMIAVRHTRFPLPLFSRQRNSQHCNPDFRFAHRRWPFW